MVEIVPLSKENIDDVYSLTLNVFHNKPEDFDYPPKQFYASLEPSKHKKLYDKYETKTLGYWVAIERKEVVGLYSMYGDDDGYWLGWYCVDQLHRGKGTGKKLLDFAIKKAKRDGKKYLRLYTSLNPIEAAAQKLYDKYGFVKTKEVDVNGPDKKRIFKELRI